MMIKFGYQDPVASSSDKAVGKERVEEEEDKPHDDYLYVGRYVSA